jgi:peptidyl-prolyl cis-trans isomerase C
VLAATSCSGGLIGPGEVASVGERSISRAALDAQLELEREVIASQVSDGPDRVAALGFFQGDGADTVPIATASEALTTLVQLAVLEEALDEVGGELTAADLDDARATLEAQGTMLDDLPTAYADQQVEFQALQNAIRAAIDVPEDELQALYEERVGDYAQVCLSVLVVETEAEADAARSRVLDGEDFASVAADVSLDPAAAETGGDAGCAATADAAAQLGLGLYEALVGEPLEPVEVGQGWVVSVITSRQVPERSEIEEQLLPQLQAPRLAEVLRPLLRDVSIHPRFGTWDPDRASVVAPVPPPADAPLDVVAGP